MNSGTCPCCGSFEELTEYGAGSSNDTVEIFNLCEDCAEGKNNCKCIGVYDRDDGCNYLLLNDLNIGNHPDCNKMTIRKPRDPSPQEREQSHQNWAEIREIMI